MTHKSRAFEKCGNCENLVCLRAPAVENFDVRKPCINLVQSSYTPKHHSNSNILTPLGSLLYLHQANTHHSRNHPQKLLISIFFIFIAMQFQLSARFVLQTCNGNLEFSLKVYLSLSFSLGSIKYTPLTGIVRQRR